MQTILQVDPWRSLYEILFARGVISEEVMQALENYSQRWQLSHYQCILDCHILAENELANHLADEFQFVRLANIQHMQHDFILREGLSYWQAKALCAVFARHRATGKDYLFLADPTAELSKYKTFQQTHVQSLGILLGEMSMLLKLIESWYPLEEQLQNDKSALAEGSIQ